MKTRSKKQTAKADAPKSAPAGPTLPASDPNPPKLFILPKDASHDARIVTLPNPASASPNRYFCCPNKGFYEFTSVAAPKTTPRSWLLAPGKNDLTANALDRMETSQHADVEMEEESAAKSDEADSNPLANGYTLKSPDVFLATPMDALFLILPALAPSTKENEKQLFLSVEDHLDSLTSSSAQLRKLLCHDALRSKIEERMAAACDTVDAGDEKMYRISAEKLAKELLSKAERLVASSFPASMEERFVRKALERSVMSIKREDSSTSLAVGENKENATDSVDSQTPTAATTDTEQSAESQESAETVATSVSASSEQKTDAPVAKPEIEAPEGVPHLLRLRTAINFISSSYLPRTLRSLVQTTFASNKLVDFSPLDRHLEHLATVRAEAQALRSLSDNIGRKRELDDEEAAEIRAEKKRKKDEEEAKKKNQSRGVKQLAKTDTSGMKKLSAFFTKAPAKK